LAIDTSGPAASAAVWADGTILAEMNLNVGLTHSETIMPAVDSVLRAAGCTCDQIDVFASVAGPGSFTGVRIGVCAVKGLAHAVGKPCVCIDALEALAMNARGFDGTICTILDARRDQVYSAAFHFENGEMPVRLQEDCAQSINEFLASLPHDGRLMFMGDGVKKYTPVISERFGDRAMLANELSTLRASAACILAAHRQAEWIDAQQLTPIYLRAPQAEREREAGIQHGI